jgi:hypothetical protein
VLEGNDDDDDKDEEFDLLYTAVFQTFRQCADVQTVLSPIVTAVGVPAIRVTLFSNLALAKYLDTLYQSMAVFCQCCLAY